MNETARHFLDCYVRGVEPVGGWAFGGVLRQARLDHSPESLPRLDALLDHVRADPTRPGRTAFLARAGGRNFCAFLVYYVMAHVGKRACARIDWYDFAGAHLALGEGLRLPEGSGSRIVAVCEDAGVALVPLAWIEDRLFAPGPTLTCAQYVDSVQAQLDHPSPVVWATAARALGLLASWAMCRVFEGAQLKTTVLRTDRDGRHPSFVSIDGDTPEEALARARAALAKPEGGVPFAALAREATVEAGDERLDAVLVELHCHGDPPLALTLAFPFRPARDPHGFAIFAPLLVEGTVPSDTAPFFHRALQAGLHGFDWPTGSWAQYQVDAVIDAMAPESGEAPVYADGQPVREGDAVLSGHGLFPSRVARVTRSPADAAGVRIEICTGVKQTLTPAAAKAQLVFVARQQVDYRAACIHWLEERVQRGASAACYTLGNVLLHGLGVAPDLRRALRLWQCAADMGHAPAMREMGLLHLRGEVLRADPHKAFDLLSRAADQGDARAYRALGKMHEKGRGVPRSLEQALVCYRRAARQGDLGALTRLARLHLEGQGVERDEARAVEWLMQAAQGGRAEAQYRLALCFEQGRGVARDRAEALRYMRMAAEHDFFDAKTRLRELEEED